MYLLKFETKFVQFEPLVSFCSFNSLQIFVKAKKSQKIAKNIWRRIEILVEKENISSQEILIDQFWSFSAAWPNFTIAKYNNSNITYRSPHKIFEKYNEQVFIEKLFLKILQYSYENTCVGVSFLKKMQAFSPVTLLKRDSSTDVFLWILRNF